MKDKILKFSMGIFMGMIMAVGGVPYMDDFQSFILWYIAFIITAILMYIISMMIHEIGHMIFGLLTGYKFLSIRFGSYMLIKRDNHIQLKRFSLAGTGGQCLMDPPDLKNNSLPIVFYNMGGCIMNIVVCIPAVLLLLLDLYWFIDFILSMFISLNVISALMNGIPFKTAQVSNDGYNTIMLCKDIESRLSFYRQMKIAAYTHHNVRLKDIDESLFEYSKQSLTNPLSQVVAVFKENQLMDLHEFDKAQELINYLLDNCNNMLGVYKHLLINDLIYIKIINNEDPSSLLTKEHKTFRNALKTMLPMIRTDYLYHKYITLDHIQMNKTYNAFHKICKTYPYQSEILSEKELMEKTI